MVNLSPYETRIIGCLLEKERTTPDQYPLTLNTLTQACNQKTNREPVLSLEETQVQQAVDSLIQKGLISEVVFGSRVTKYKQRFGNTEFSEYPFNTRELSLLCVLFLRGPQTAGELRTRTQRLCEFADVTQVDNCLDELSKREPNAYVVALEKEPGKRENRFMHLFSGEKKAFSVDVQYPSKDTLDSQKSAPHQVHVQTAKGSDIDELVEKVANLETRVDELHAEIQEMKKLWS